VFLTLLLLLTLYSTQENTEMATIEQLSAALVKADAAGNTADAKVFADALRAMKAQQQPASAQAPAAPVAPAAPSPAPQSPNLLDSTLATVNGITGSIPFLQQGTDALIAGGQTGLDAITGQPVDFGARYNGIRDSRTRVADKAPLANTLGGIGGTIGATALLGGAPAGAEALGMTGNWLRQLTNSALSTAGYEGLQGLAHGHLGGQLLGDMGIGAATGLGGSVVGQTLNKAGETVANALTSGAQSKITNAAIKNAPSAADLKDAGAKLFDSSTGVSTAPMIAPAALDRLETGISSSLAKIRPNAANDPQAVGLLQHVVSIVDQAKQPGTVVDFKDLHLTRQLAQKVAQSSQGRDAAIGSIVIKQIDDFIKGLKPGDILGGTNPRQAANDLMQGISTWRRAQKVSMIESAIQHAQTYKSGFENGLKLSFLKLMKTPDFARLSKVEQDAIRTVAKGTTRQNIAEGLGKLGFSLGNGAAHNILGGTAGTGVVGSLLTPFLGAAAFPAALGITSAVGAVGRRAAESLATSGAERAARVLATPNIPVAPQAQNLLGRGNIPLQLLIRGSGAAALNR
jgi:hypothetical protein